MGITDSNGVNHDFGGSYYVNKSPQQSIFGVPCKSYNLYPQLTQEQIQNYDTILQQVTRRYEHKCYSFCCQNCHNFVADVMNEMDIKTKKGKRIGVINLVTNFFFKMKRI